MRLDLGNDRELINTTTKLRRKILRWERFKQLFTSFASLGFFVIRYGLEIKNRRHWELIIRRDRHLVQMLMGWRTLSASGWLTWWSHKAIYTQRLSLPLPPVSTRHTDTHAAFKFIKIPLVATPETGICYGSYDFHMSSPFFATLSGVWLKIIGFRNVLEWKFRASYLPSFKINTNWMLADLLRGRFVKTFRT